MPKTILVTWMGDVYRLTPAAYQRALRRIARGEYAFNVDDFRYIGTHSDLEHTDQEGACEALESLGVCVECGLVDLHRRTCPRWGQ